MGQNKLTLSPSKRQFIEVFCLLQQFLIIKKHKSRQRRSMTQRSFWTYFSCLNNKKNLCDRGICSALISVPVLWAYLRQEDFATLLMLSSPFVWSSIKCSKAFKNTAFKTLSNFRQSLMRQPMCSLTSIIVSTLYFEGYNFCGVGSS